MKDSINKLIILTVIIIVVFTSGIFATMSLVRDSKLKNVVYGALGIKANAVVDNSEFEIVFDGFSEVADSTSNLNQFILCKTFYTEVTDLSKSDLIVNNDLLCCANAQKIRLDTSIYKNFYNYKNNLLHSGCLSISIVLYENNLKFVFSTSNSETASYFSEYFKNNGLKIKLVDSTFNYEQEDTVITNDTVSGTPSSNTDGPTQPSTGSI